jgi:hypothetical protein
MRNSGLVLGALLLVCVPASAQTPLVAIAPAGPARDDLGPRTVLPAMVACTDLPAAGSAPEVAMRIQAPHAPDRHLISNRGHIVVLNGGTPQGYAVGQRYFARRWQPPVDRERTGPASHPSIRTAGWLTIIAADERSALARVDYACDTVLAGDYLEPYVEGQLPGPVAAGGESDFATLGRVMSGSDRRQRFGDGDFLNIDRGSEAGLAPGTLIAFYRDRQNGTPLVNLGLGVVLEVSATTSKVVVQRAVDAIEANDYYAIRRPQVP